MTAELSGRLVRGVHIFPLRVYYEDTDAAGIVYYANYLKFAERARTEMMRRIGLSHSQMMEQLDAAFIVRQCRVDYRAPARIDDLLEVHTRIRGLKGASIEAEQVVKRNGAELVRLDLKIACVAADGRPVRLPGMVRAGLVPLIQKDQSQAKG